MATRQTDYFTISRPNDLDALEEQLAKSELAEIIVDIPDGATTLFTAREFRRLAAAAQAARVVVRVATEDPLRRELAWIIGLPLVDPIDHRPSASDTRPADLPAESPAEPSADAPTSRIDLPPATDTAPTASVPLTPWRGLDTVAPVDEDEMGDDSYSFVITPPGRHHPVQTEDLDASWAAWSSRQFDPAHEIAPAHRRSSRHGRRAAVSILILLTILVALLVAVAPSATIAVTPRIDAVEARVTVGLDQPGRSFDVHVAPAAIGATVTASASIPTTGERFIPDAAATGSLLLTNPRLTPVHIEAGAIATDASGGEYATTTDITVPPADPYGSMTFGSATAPIRAVAPGAEGNADAETIYGQWDNGIFFTNRDPITGGTMKRIATVSDADRASLEKTVRGDLDARSSTTLDGLVPVGATLLEGSMQRGEATLRFDHAAGDDATTLHLEASLPVSGQVFDPEAMKTQATAEATRRLSDLAGDAKIVAGSIVVGASQPLGATAGDGFSVTATAQAAQPIDGSTLDALRADASGKRVSDITSAAKQIPGVQTAEVDRRYSGFWGRMPLLRSRIMIEVQGAETTVPTETTPTGR